MNYGVVASSSSGSNCIHNLETGITRIRGPPKNTASFQRWTTQTGSDKPVSTCLPQGEAHRFPIGGLKISSSHRCPHYEKKEKDTWIQYWLKLLGSPGYPTLTHIVWIMVLLHLQVGLYMFVYLIPKHASWELECSIDYCLLSKGNTLARHGQASLHLSPLRASP